MSKSKKGKGDTDKAVELYNHGCTCFDAQRYKQAKAAFQSALTHSPDMTDALYGLGVTNYRLGNYDEAIKWLKEYASSAPKDIYAHFELGVAYHARGEFKKAVSEYRKALNIDPSFAAAYLNMGICSEILGMTSMAKACYEDAVDFDPELESAQNNLNRMYAEVMTENPAMEYRKFGNLDWRVSALGFGTLRLPTIKGDYSRIDEAAAFKMIRRAIGGGINFIDTSFDAHGGNGERLLGKVLTKEDRKTVRICTKLPSWLIESKSDFDRYFFEQLERLNTDHVDFYLLHSMNRDLWPHIRDLG
ncbi:MAG: tetratricopeptide repeat protein, partial [Methanosarcinaceae archaeon]|nr:tetratricopeptide repeat protein [Methanosarcinaceae archaeon]